MRKISIFTLLIVTGIFTTFFSSGCGSGNLDGFNGNDYLVFGHFYGECLGETCIEIFKLEPDRLKEDQKDNYPGDRFYNGNFEKVSDEKFELARDLINEFPSTLLDHKNGVIGQPDAGDWGGLYVEYKVDGTRKYWLIDQKADNIPAYLIPFKDEVNRVIGEISN